ncbi:MAG: hypothetical protein PHI24_12955 [Desulfitobacteriaceae bacterium]|nr:hypothetical protein [Desulfitobacteriaceae bacterium]
MRKSWNHSDIITQYKSSCDIMYRATLDGDYKANNKEGKKLIDVFKFLEKNRELAVETLSLLLGDENVVTRTKAAAHCLALKINTSEAEKILKVESEKKENGIFGFNAEMTLKVWKETGCLKVYQK